MSKPTLEFSPIHGEQFRQYRYPGGETVIARNVTGICVRPSGSHRLNTASGKKLIVAPGWICIEIEADHWSV